MDQNLAFNDADMGGFWDEHIFRASISEWTDGFRTEMLSAMNAALSGLPQWWQEMPEDWTEIDCGMELSSVQKLLSRFEQNQGTFWRPI